MPRSLHFSDLQTKYNENSDLARSELNSLILFAKQQQVLSAADASLQTTDSVIEFDKSFPVPYWFGSYCSEQIPPYSIYTLKDGSENVYWPFAVEVAKYNNTEPCPMLLTNGGSAIYGTTVCNGLSRVADTLCPILLRWVNDGDGNPPVVGKQVGPVHNDFTVSADGKGLLVLAIDIANGTVKCLPYVEDKLAVVTVYGPDANEDCVWPGKIAKHLASNSHCSDKFPNGNDCVLVVLNSETGSTGTKESLPVGEHYIGLKVGEYYIDEDSTVPIYVIRDTSADKDRQAIVRVYVGTADENCLYQGKVQKYTPDNSHCTDRFSNTTSPDCYLVLLNDVGGSASPGSIKQILPTSSLHLGRKVGNFVHEDTTITPVYAIRTDTTQAYAVTITSVGSGGSGDLAPGASGNVVLYTGRTVTAYNWHTTITLKIGDKCGCWYEWTDDTWFLIKSGEQFTLWSGVANADTAPGVSVANNVTLSTTEIKTAFNQSSYAAILAGDLVTVYKNPFNGIYYAISSGASAGKIWRSIAEDNIAHGTSGDVTLSSGATVSAENWSDSVDIVSTDKIHVYRDAFDNAYVAFKATGGTNQRTLKAALDDDLLTTDGTATITSVTNLAGSAPGVTPTSATNHLKCAGFSGEVCYVIEETSSVGVKTYHLTQVEWDTATIVTNVYVSGLSIRETKQQMLSKATGTSADTLLFAVENVIVVLDVFDNATDLSQTKRTVTTISSVDDSASVPIIDIQDYVVLTDITVSSTSLREEYRTIRAFAHSDDTSDTEIAPLAEYSFVSNVYDDTSALKQTKRSVFAFSIADDSVAFSIIGIENYTVVIDVSADDDSLDYEDRTVRAFTHTDDTASHKIADIDACE